jgi:hypothetical protein
VTSPLVSVGVPLYRSRPFLESLRANCRDLAGEASIEIIVSDRHCHDDAIDRLQSEWGGDRRFRFLKSDDRLDWVQHMNLLLAEARGEYFRWLPHDDVLPRGSTGPLSDWLEREPRTVLAYAPTRAIDPSGRRMPERDRLASDPVAPGSPWTVRHSLDLFWRGWCDGAFKGLFRRRRVMDARLFIRPTHEMVSAERAWLFGISLLGALSQVPDSIYLKRFHDDSTSAQWRPGARHLLSVTTTMCGYLRDHGPDPWTRCYGMAYLWVRAAGRLRRHLANGVVRG